MENEPNFEGEKMKMPTERETITSSDQATKDTKGVFIFGMIAALVVILAGLVYWYIVMQEPAVVTETPTRPTLETNKEPETTTATAQTESYGAMSTSDEITAIEADLESTNLEAIDSELQQIDIELESSVE